MADKNYQAIIDALDLLANGTPKKTKGNITGVNVAAEAGISKATLYRYFNDHTELLDAYNSLRKNGIRLSDDAPETIQQAYLLIKEEVKHLRSELSEVKKISEQTNKLKSHQIQILWMDNERLQNEVRRLSKSKFDNVIMLHENNIIESHIDKKLVTHLSGQNGFKEQQKSRTIETNEAD